MNVLIQIETRSWDGLMAILTTIQREINVKKEEIQNLEESDDLFFDESNLNGGYEVTIDQIKP
jgi:hypothetical protein